MLLPDDTLHVAPEGAVGHAGLRACGQPVLAAGELWARDGKVLAPSNKSGPYRPPREALEYTTPCKNYLKRS